MVRVTLGALAALLLVASAAAADPETAARRIEGKLMAPCCMANPISDHYSGAAQRMKAEIRRMLAAGKSEGEILDTYVAQHGEQILASPKASGFNLAAYLVPFLMLIGGAVVVLFLMRRWSAARPEEAASTAAPLSPEEAERLKRELAKLD